MRRSSFSFQFDNGNYWSIWNRTVANIYMEIDFMREIILKGTVADVVTVRHLRGYTEWSKCHAACNKICWWLQFSTIWLG
jgi:hypothetical protein